ncbi:MAG TPA: cysteine--tRNA ligase [Paracoccaceae bacterium]|nr:cysteine--tRNA ligase [Paracoccaceae bacterium]
MTTIRLTNTATRATEAFAPIDPARVRVYVCGPTVYDRAHLGNARPVVVFDVLYRLLRQVYGSESVTYVRNFTDVDDKINAEAQRRRAAGAEGTLEDLIRARTEETIAWYHDDMDALGALRPTLEPRATDHIGQMIGMIEGLVATGHAYAAEGHVLFRVRSYPGYGRLSGRSPDDMLAGARVEVAPYKEDPLDFVLWKPSDADLPGWDSPWGRGRPGWHIECSAMAADLLGESFDIHGGGIDLAFPHHENEIAQSACAHPGGAFARVWLHNEMLLVDGQKMSKSLGNFFTVRDLLDEGVPGEVIRAAFLLSHYRDPMDLSGARRAEALAVVTDMAVTLGSDGSQSLAVLGPGEPLPEGRAALADDLSTPEALRHLNRKALEARFGRDGLAARLPDIYASQLLLGFDLSATRTAEDQARITDRARGHVFQALREAAEIEEWADEIAAARAAQDWARADALRAQVAEAGAQVNIGREGVSILRLPGFDPARLGEPE